MKEDKVTKDSPSQSNSPKKDNNHHDTLPVLKSPKKSPVTQQKDSPGSPKKPVEDQKKSKPFGFAAIGSAPTFASFSSSSSGISPFATLSQNSPSVSNGGAEGSNSIFSSWKPEEASKKKADDERENDVDDGKVASALGSPISKKVKLQAEPVAVSTGEEDEDTILKARCKLFNLDKETKDWKERGIGVLKFNKKRISPFTSRLVMRTDGSLKLILNCSLFKGIPFEIVQERFIRLSGFEKEDDLCTFLIKMKNKEEAQHLLKLLEEYKDNGLVSSGTESKDFTSEEINDNVKAVKSEENVNDDEPEPEPDSDDDE